MGAEISRSTDNGKITVSASGNEFKYWEIEKLPKVKEWAKANKILTGYVEVMEGDKKKKVWSVYATFDTVKEANNFVAEVKKVKEFYTQFEENMQSLMPDNKKEEKSEPKAAKPKVEAKKAETIAI